LFQQPTSSIALSNLKQKKQILETYLDHMKTSHVSAGSSQHPMLLFLLHSRVDIHSFNQCLSTLELITVALALTGLVAYKEPFG
jgi:hypothetical protein